MSDGKSDREISPATSINISSDPCNVSSVLDNAWRSVSTGFSGYDDTVVEWNGWYRLYLQGRSAQMPERVFYSGYVSCGGYSSLLLEGPHPLLKDGVVTRDVYGSNPQYISYKSNPIQVKACPGNYYVYRLVKPAVSLPMPTYCAVAFNTPSYDPCNSYNFLDQPWRGTNETGGSNCDSNFYWTGWYRLLYKGMSVRMPESCVNRSRCGTDVGLWLNGSHPQIEDGIITRGVCGSSGSDCCFYRSYPIRVKACPGNYYIYEFVGPNYCYLAYCADIILLTPAAETPVPNITVSTECKDNFTPKCGEDLFNQLENITAQVLPPQVVVKYLDMVLNTQEQLLKVETASPEKMASYGNTVLNRTEKLVSTLVKPTETTDSVNISRNGLDIQVFAVGPKASLNEIPQLRISSTQMDIDLIQISKNNDGSAAAAFMSFSNMASMLKPNFFNTTNNTVKTMMSIVVSATLPKTTNMQLPRPVNFTLEHIEEIDPNGTLSCVYWNNTVWVEDGCSLLQTNSSHSVCSCVHLSTFALIMQTNPDQASDSDPLLELLNTVAVAVGLFFLSLSLLTFALCHQHMRVNLTPLINLCISLFLAHLLFLLTQTFLQYMQTNPLCAVLAGVLHFLFLSAFVWMFFEAVLLLISVKNLKKIQSKQKEVLSWKCLIVIGYVIPLIVVGVSIGLFPDGYGSEQCWIKTDRDFVWSFLGPVCFIIIFNLIFFIMIIITLRKTVAGLNSEFSQMKQMRILIFKTLIQIVILGCPWILGFFVNGSKVLGILFLFLNSQQGTFIFLVHCVLNQEIRKQYRNWLNTLCCCFKPSDVMENQHAHIN
ncbi:adhesion G protein-coupled receptor E3-like [Pygocentrus nattereri]|nr:adhesion G protein-coupled receptor E3-like [Pygocentrus nattereri]